MKKTLLGLLALALVILFASVVIHIGNESKLKPLRCESAALEAGDRLQGISMNVFLIRDDGDGPCIVYSRDKIDPKRIGDKIIVFVTPDLNADVKKYLVWTDGAVIESAEFYRYIERGHRE